MSAVPTFPEHSRAEYCWHRLIQAVKILSQAMLLNKPSTFSKNTACTLTGPLGELISSLQNPRGKEGSYLLLSHLPPAAARAAHHQHKHLDCGGCAGVCLCWCLHIHRLLGYPGCDQCPEKQGKGDTETHPAILRSLPTASQLLKLWEHKEVALVLKILFETN